MPARAVFPLMLVRATGLPSAWLHELAHAWQTAEEAIQVGERERSLAMQTLQAAFDHALAAIPEDSFLRTAVYNARKSFFQRQKRPTEQLIRQLEQDAGMPPVAALLEAIGRLAEAETGLNSARNQFHREYEQALARGYAILQQIVTAEQFQRSLLFASHSLLEQLPGFSATPVTEFAKKERQTALAALQYATRMTVKTSPLSRFSTVSVQAVSGLPEPVDIPEPAWLNAVVTPNVALLQAIYQVLLREPVFYKNLSICLNPSMVATADTSYQWLYFDGVDEGFQQMPADPTLDFIVEMFLAENQGLVFSTAVLRLQETIDAPAADLERYLLNLVDHGFFEWVLPENGLTPAWCGNLYRYLGFLPAEPVIVAAATLLQWLRTAARTLPFQPVAEARVTQREAAEQIRQFFERFQADVPAVPPEHIFFEDVEQTREAGIPPEVIPELASQLAEAWVKRPVKPLPARRAAVLDFFKKHYPEQRSVDFLEFTRAFLSRESTPPLKGRGAVMPSMTCTNAHTAEDIAVYATAPLPFRGGAGGGVAPAGQVPQSPKLMAMGGGVGVDSHRAQPALPSNDERTRIGVILQMYREKNDWYAVVNGLYPGGGKLFARWLHLFPTAVQHQLAGWLKKETDELTTVPFPWQGWFNANFQPVSTDAALHVPGGRQQTGAAGPRFLLGHLKLSMEASGLNLSDKITGKHLVLNDLGLEAPETRPPAIRTLWDLGVPYISLDCLLPEGLWQPLYEENIRYRPRHSYRNLVLARAAWALEPVVWRAWRTEKPESVEFFIQARTALRAMGVPRHFFARFEGEKPQYFDQNSPLLMLLFHKTLQKGDGILFLTEMLPSIDTAASGSTRPHIMEFVLELEV